MNFKPLNKDFGVEGMTTPKIKGLLNHYASKAKVYVECGSYQGQTLCVAAYNNPQTKVIGIDNFSWPKKPGIEKKLKTAIKQFDNIEFIKADTFDGLCEIAKRGLQIDVFFYDAFHSYDATFNALEMAALIASDDAVFIIDDTNWEYVEQAVDNFCKEHEWEVIFQKKTPENGYKTWWNGITVIKKINHEKSKEKTPARVQTENRKSKRLSKIQKV